MLFLFFAKMLLTNSHRNDMIGIGRGALAMSMFRQVTIPQRLEQKGVRAEEAVPVTQLLGIFPNRDMTVIVMMECYRRYTIRCTSFYSIISHEPPVFNRFFHIFKNFLEE